MRSGDPEKGRPRADAEIRFDQALIVWVKISLLSFGGPAGQIAVMHRLLVDELKWVSEKRFLHALNFCMLLPGPEAQQLTIYLGWLLHRVRGGVVAGVMFVLPGALTVLVLSMIYVTYQQSAAVGSVFFGVKAAVLAIVTTALWRLGRKVIRRRFLMVITAASFIASFVFSIPFPLVIIGAALAALLGGGAEPSQSEAGRKHDGDGPGGVASAGYRDSESDFESDSRAIDSRVTTQPPARHWALLVALTCGVLWLAPVAVLHGWLGAGHIYSQQAMFFSQVAVVTFGGAYAVLSYMAQQTVGHYGWLSAGEMLDGLGMAETTPGPLIMVTQFVGFIGAFRNPGILDPMLAGCLGAFVTTWVTFAPCFLWIFLGAPYIEALRGNRTLAVALTGITAAVVGVVLNLAIWFGLRVMFTELVEVSLPGGGLAMTLPSPASFDPLASAIMATSLLAIARFRVGMVKVLVTSAATGLALGSVGLV
ncbi:MAG: chromate transporter [Candidatus Puniceispirillaceae bacterium]